jgi:hypothetical protein
VHGTSLLSLYILAPAVRVNDRIGFSGKQFLLEVIHAIMLLTFRKLFIKGKFRDIIAPLG